MGCDLPHWEGFGRITSQGGPKDHGEVTLERKVWRMGIPPAGGRTGRGNTAGSEYLLLPPPEQSCTVYCNQAHYGPVTGSRAYIRVKDDQAVVGALCIGCGEDAERMRTAAQKQNTQRGRNRWIKRRRRQTNSLVG